jgi:ankyrin repeat protein
MSHRHITNLLDLPNEILFHIISYIDWNSIQKLRGSTRKFNILCEHSHIYENSMRKEYGDWILDPKYINGCMNYSINILCLNKKSQIDTLCKYICENKWNIVKFLIRHIIDKNTRNKDGDTAGIVLLKFGFWYIDGQRIIEFILRGYIIDLDITATNHHGRSMLTYGCLNCDVSMLKLILNHKSFRICELTRRDKYGWNNLMYAIVYNRTDVTKYLHNKYNIFLSRNDIIELEIYIKLRCIIQSRWSFNDTLRRISEIEDFEEEYSEIFRTVSNNLDSTTNVLLSNEISERLINDEDIISTNMNTVCHANNVDKYRKYISMESNIQDWVDDMFVIYKNTVELDKRKHIIMKVYNTIVEHNINTHFREDEINTCIMEINTRTSKHDNVWKYFINTNQIQIKTNNKQQLTT